jgi:hypothetical protein
MPPRIRIPDLLAEMAARTQFLDPRVTEKKGGDAGSPDQPACVTWRRNLSVFGYRSDDRFDCFEDVSLEVMPPLAVSHVKVSNRHKAHPGTHGGDEDDYSSGHACLLLATFMYLDADQVRPFGIPGVERGDCKWDYLHWIRIHTRWEVNPQ